MNLVPTPTGDLGGSSSLWCWRRRLISPLTTVRPCCSSTKSQGNQVSLPPEGMSDFLGERYRGRATLIQSRILRSPSTSRLVVARPVLLVFCSHRKIKVKMYVAGDETQF